MVSLSSILSTLSSLALPLIFRRLAAAELEFVWGKSSHLNNTLIRIEKKIDLTSFFAPEGEAKKRFRSLTYLPPRRAARESAPSKSAEFGEMENSPEKASEVDEKRMRDKIPEVHVSSLHNVYDPHDQSELDKQTERYTALREEYKRLHGTEPDFIAR